MPASPIQLQNFIGGKFVDPRCNHYLDSRNPSRGTVHSLVPDSDNLDVEDAVHAAQKAFSSWSTKDAAYRSKLLTKVADLLESRAEEFAEAESRDQGKPLWVARAVDIPRAVLNFRHFANAILCEKDICISEPERGVLHYTSRSPCGVVAIIVPWNLPLYLLTFKLAPALVHGNTVIAKPSEFTSLTAWMLCSLLKEAGFPDGVVNMVFGRGDSAGEALIRHPQVQLISFTGSDRAGLHIASVAGASAKKVSLEMGGKNACIIFADADLEECIPTLIRGSFLNQGQICLSTSRIYVEKSVFHIFVEKFVEEVRKIHVGDPFQPDTWMGPVCSREHFDRIRMYLKIAQEEGATFLSGNEEEQQFQLPDENKNGYYIGPVVLTGLPDESRCVQEEIFGPVTCVLPFEGVEEIIRRANAVRYGLSACIWSRDIGKIHSIAPRLEVMRGGDGMAGFAVRHPSGNLVLPYFWKPSAEYEEQSADPGGYYLLCIDNSLSRFASKLVSLYVNAFKRDKWEDYVKELEDVDVTVTNFTETLQTVDGRIGEMLKYQDHSRRQMSKDWYLVDSNHTYIQQWSVAQCIVIFLTSTLQVYFVRKLFDIKNVTPTSKPRA